MTELFHCIQYFSTGCSLIVFRIVYCGGVDFLFKSLLMFFLVHI